MKKFGGAGRLKKACKQRVCTTGNILPCSQDCATNTPPPNISETITRLKSSADKYREHDIKPVYLHSLRILTYVVIIGNNCHILQHDEGLTRDEILQVEI